MMSRFESAKTEKLDRALIKLATWSGRVLQRSARSSLFDSLVLRQKVTASQRMRPSAQQMIVGSLSTLRKDPIWVVFLPFDLKPRLGEFWPKLFLAQKIEVVVTAGAAINDGGKVRRKTEGASA
jgi:hypothetical protein